MPLPIGAPEGLAGDGARGGYVAWVDTGPDGADTSSAEQVDQSSHGLPGSPEAGDRFGEAVAAGDVDADGHTDLVVTAPDENVEEHTDAGLLQVVFGDADGLSDEAIGLHSPRQERGDTGFGSALAVADFNGDGRDDMALSAEDQVTVVWGREDLRDADDPPVQVLDAAPSPDDTVTALQAADVDGDGRPDLVAASARDGEDPKGDLQVFTGAAEGVTPQPLGEQLELPSHTGAVGAGDLDADGRADVVAAFDGEAPRVFPGTPDGLDDDGPELDADLGSSAVAVGDIDADGHADIAIGDAARSNADDEDDSGAVDIAFGGPDYTDGRTQTFQQGTDGVAGAAEADDRMGDEVALVDLTGEGTLDLVAGVPGENGGNGAVTILYADNGQLTGTGSQTFGGATLGLDGTSAEFGRGLPR